MPPDADELIVRKCSSAKRVLPWQIYTFPLVLALEFLALENIPLYGFHIHDVAIRIIVFCAVLLFFGRTRLSGYPFGSFYVSYPFACLHLLNILAMFLLVRLFAQHVANGTWSFQLGTSLFSILALLLVLTLVLTLLPLRRLFPVARSLGVAWIYAAVCWKLSVYVRGFFIHNAWDDRTSKIGHALQFACLSGSGALLRLFYPHVYANPASMILGTPRYLVFISGVCSGIEGLALVLVLTVAWLIFTRREMRVLRAALLVPVALLLVWMMNVVRVAMMVMIGDAGHPKISDKGFHSEAGWITFNMASLGFLFVAQRVSWFRKDGGLAQGPHALSPASTSVATQNPTAVFLAPFLAITAASMIGQATTGSFEWLYPLRLAAAVVALWVFRKEYRRMDWRFGLAGTLAGLAIGILWIAIHYIMAGWHFQPPSESVIGFGLLRLTPVERVLWIVSRAVTAVVAVPIAEELAFRGFVARRVIAADFENVSFTRLTALSIAISSVLFGLMHGRMWFAGIIAGVVFALVAKRRGRLGEAVASHAVANLAITVVVLVTRDYSLW